MFCSRALRSRKFLSFVEKDIDRREQKRREYWKSCTPPKKVLSKEQTEGFFDRLVEDGAKRFDQHVAASAFHDMLLSRKEKHEQQVQEKHQKEEKMLKDMATKLQLQKSRLAKPRRASSRRI